MIPIVIPYPVSTGGGGGATEKDVNFYDYDGTRVYAYTVAEANALTALPAQPTHAGLTGQGWNYTLAQVNDATQPLDVGAMYITDDGKTRLYIELPDTLRTTIPLYFSQTVTNGVTIDWGDGSATETVSGTGGKNTSHAYAANGAYCITLEVTAGTLGLGNGSSATAVIGGEIRGYQNMFLRAEIGASVTSVGDSAFRNCYALKSVVIPSGVKSVGDYAFGYCYALQSVVIPSGVTSVGTSAFRDCHALKSVVIPSGVKSVGDDAFYYCYALQSVVIPSGVTSVGTSAFRDCRALKSVVIPSGVASVGTSVFRDCHALQSVVIPSGVTSVGTYAFSDCTLVKEYHFLRTTPPTLSNANAFSGIPSDCIIYVPTTSLGTYKNAANWSTYASQMIGE